MTNPMTSKLKPCPVDIRALAESRYTKGPWYVAQGCSWRRIRSDWTSGEDVEVITPINQNDGHPDLSCAKGHDRMANLNLAAAAPQLLDIAIQSKAREDALIEALKELIEHSELGIAKIVKWREIYE